MWNWKDSEHDEGKVLQEMDRVDCGRQLKPSQKNIDTMVLGLLLLVVAGGVTGCVLCFKENGEDETVDTVSWTSPSYAHFYHSATVIRVQPTPHDIRTVEVASANPA